MNFFEIDTKFRIVGIYWTFFKNWFGKYLNSSIIFVKKYLILLLKSVKNDMQRIKYCKSGDWVLILSCDSSTKHQTSNLNMYLLVFLLSLIILIGFSKWGTRLL